MKQKPMKRIQPREAKGRDIRQAYNIPHLPIEIILTNPVLQKQNSDPIIPTVQSLVGEGLFLPNLRKITQRNDLSV